MDIQQLIGNAQMQAGLCECPRATKAIEAVIEICEAQERRIQQLFEVLGTHIAWDDTLGSNNKQVLLTQLQ